MFDYGLSVLILVLRFLYLPVLLAGVLRVTLSGPLSTAFSSICSSILRQSRWPIPLSWTRQLIPLVSNCWICDRHSMAARLRTAYRQSYITLGSLRDLTMCYFFHVPQSPLLTPRRMPSLLCEYCQDVASFELANVSLTLMASTCDLLLRDPHWLTHGAFIMSSRTSSSPACRPNNRSPSRGSSPCRSLALACPDLSAMLSHSK